MSSKLLAIFLVIVLIVIPLLWFLFHNLSKKNKPAYHQTSGFEGDQAIQDKFNKINSSYKNSHYLTKGDFETLVQSNSTVEDETISTIEQKQEDVLNSPSYLQGQEELRAQQLNNNHLIDIDKINAPVTTITTSSSSINNDANSSQYAQQVVKSQTLNSQSSMPETSPVEIVTAAANPFTQKLESTNVVNPTSIVNPLEEILEPVKKQEVNPTPKIEVPISNPIVDQTVNPVAQSSPEVEVNNINPQPKTNTTSYDEKLAPYLNKDQDLVIFLVPKNKNNSISIKGISKLIIDRYKDNYEFVQNKESSLISHILKFKNEHGEKVETFQILTDLALPDLSGNDVTAVQIPRFAIKIPPDCYNNKTLADPVSSFIAIVMHKLAVDPIIIKDGEEINIDTTRLFYDIIFKRAELLDKLANSNK